jgi:hypothetical protein
MKKITLALAALLLSSNMAFALDNNIFKNESLSSYLTYGLSMTVITSSK